VSKAGELAAVGDAAAVTRKLKTYLDAGATDVLLVSLQSELANLQPVWDVAATL
jgi:hypothetical protein